MTDAPPDVDQFLNLAGNVFQALVQAPETVQGAGDAEQGLGVAGGPLLRGHVPKGHHLTGRLVLLVVENGPVENNVQQPPVPCQALGFETVHHFFAKQPPEPLTGFFPKAFGHERNPFALPSRQRSSRKPLRRPG